MSEKKELKTFDKISTSELKKIGVQALPNRPNEGSVYGNAGLSPKELKEWFDKMALRLANHINSVTNIFGTEEIAQYIRISLDQHNVGTLQGFIDAVLDGSFAENLLMVLPTATDTERASLQEVVFSINRKMSTEIDRVEKLITDLGYGYTDADVVFVEDGGEVGADVVAEDDNGARRLLFTFRNFGKGVAEAALGFPLKEGTGENSLVQKTDSDKENKAIAENSIAIGSGTKASGKNALSKGANTKATGENSEAGGNGTIASGANATAEGLGKGVYGGVTYEGEASGLASHVEGIGTVASGEAAHAENFGNTASGKASHAGGIASESAEKGSFAHGYCLRATRDFQAVFGMYNKENSNAVFIVGNGTGLTNPKNALEVLRDGSIRGAISTQKGTYIGTGAGDPRVDGVSLTFDFDVQILVVSGALLYFCDDPYRSGIKILGASLNVSKMANEDGTYTIEWVHSKDGLITDQRYVLNTAGVTYRYFAIG